MKKLPSKGPQRQGATRAFVFRLPDDLYAAVERYRARLAKQTPGVIVNASDAVRALLWRAVNDVEQGSGREEVR